MKKKKTKKKKAAIASPVTVRKILFSAPSVITIEKFSMTLETSMGVLTFHPNPWIPYSLQGGDTLQLDLPPGLTLGAWELGSPVK